jgi:hypothetical protein
MLKLLGLLLFKFDTLVVVVGSSRSEPTASVQRNVPVRTIAREFKIQIELT